MIRTFVLVGALAFFATAARFEDVPEEVRTLSGEKLISYINKQGKWQAGINSKFEGLNKEELKQFLGALQKPAHMRRRSKPVKPSKLVSAPSAFNSENAWPECASVIGRIQDQSRCGSCWAVSTSSVMADRLCIASKGKIQTEISALDLMSCCSFCGYQCQGGWPVEAFYQFAYNGIVTGSNFTENKLCKPYPIAPCYHDDVTGKNVCPEEPTTGFKCEKSCQKSYNVESYTNDKYYGKDVRTFAKQNDAAIAELVNNGPLVAAFSVYEDFYLYKSGIYEYTAGKYLGGHAVRIVGFGSENGTDYWLVSNSWGYKFGEKGYFRIRRGTNEVGFESEITTVSADLDRSQQNKQNKLY